MKIISAVSLAALLVLGACSSGPRVTYSGHQESTEGVPGFVKGKKVAPTVKLGQSYTVDGETFVPRHEPDYVEEGMASWYGPGFHGGKTANGEIFDKHDMTAAHRTLPLPSIVRVTMLSTGKQAYVRINDRGPFSRGRIIDLSRRAAEEVGLVAKGVAKVRVEYLPEESQRFADLLAEGRSPKSINLAEEIIGQTPKTYAQAEPEIAVTRPPEVSPDDVQDVEEDILPVNRVTAAPLSDIVSADLTAPSTIAPAASPKPTPRQAVAANLPARVTPSVAIASTTGDVIQLGAFQQQANAERLRDKFKSAGNVFVIAKPAANGANLYHVRMGPFANPDLSAEMIDRLAALGADAKIVRE